MNVATTSLGDVLVDGKGMTLYTYAADSGGKSACTGDCLGNWPAVIGDGATPGTGLDAEDFATITRDDGARQITSTRCRCTPSRATRPPASRRPGAGWQVVRDQG